MKINVRPFTHSPQSLRRRLGGFTQSPQNLSRRLGGFTQSSRNLSRRLIGLRRSLVSETGSAILEFVMLAVPLFIPLGLYLERVNSSAQSAIELRSMTRQIARAFVTSPTEAEAAVRAREVLSFYQNQILPARGDKSLLDLSISCESQPCLTPNSKVTIVVTEMLSGQSSSATQIVDSWRNSG